MTGLDGIRSALGQSYTAIENLGAVMSPAQWQAQSLCPDWTVRAVIGHLASVEQMLAGWLPASADDLPPFDRAAAFAQQAAALDDAAFAARVAQTFGQLRLVHGHPRLRLLGARARHHHAPRPAD
jgi:uncharacterized protein (TIGR03083 family)